MTFSLPAIIFAQNNIVEVVITLNALHKNFIEVWLRLDINSLPIPHFITDKRRIKTVIIQISIVACAKLSCRCIQHI